jgi:hypothetical protein
MKAIKSIKAAKATSKRPELKIGELFPDISVYKDKSNYEIFEMGIGCKKYPIKNFIEVEIDDLASGDLFDVKEYCAKYGKHCCLAGLDRFMATTVEGYLMSCLNCKVDKEFYYEFEKNFGRDLISFKDYFMSVFGMFSFDIVGFDDFLIKKYGYDVDKDGSMKDFLTKRYGKDFTEGFVKNLIDSPK